MKYDPNNAKQQAEAVNVAYMLLCGLFVEKGKKVEDLSEDLQHMFWHLHDAQYTLRSVHEERKENG